MTINTEPETNSSGSQTSDKSPRDLTGLLLAAQGRAQELEATSAQQYFALGVFKSHILWMAAELHLNHYRSLPDSLRGSDFRTCPDPGCARTRTVLARPLCEVPDNG